MPGLGTLLNFGAGGGDAPVIVSVVDDGNADSATISLTGEGTIQLYYRIRGDAAWIVGLTRTDSGDIVQTGLTTPNWYEFVATATQGSVESLPSNLATAYIAGTDILTIMAAIVTILLGDATVTGLVGDRIYPVYVPQGVSGSAITIQLISAPRVSSFDGPGGLVFSRYQFNAWGATYGNIEQVLKAVRLAIDGYVGTVGGRVIQNIEMEDEADINNITPGVDKLRRMGKRMDFNIFYNEATS